MLFSFFSKTLRTEGEQEQEEYEFEAELFEEPVSESQATVQDQRISELEQKLLEKEEDCASLKRQLDIERFGIQRFSNDNSMISFYTGFTSYITFTTFFNCIKPATANMQSAYYVSSDAITLAGRKRNMLLIDELFMFLCRLKVGLLEQDLSVRFNCSVSTVSRKIVTWANFLYFALGSIPIWLPRDTIQELMPECFKTMYPRTRVIIDCTELRTQQPSSLVLNSQSYSHYKGTNTFKCLLGIAPHGAITFISSLYTGCMSDVEVTKLSGLLDLLEPGDDVMADKGFTIRKLLSEKGVTLNIPEFLSNKRQFTVSEIEHTEQVAKLRIHIERMNRRIKEFHLFDTPIPLSLAGSANQLWTVACMLALFKGPLVQAWSTQTS